MTAQLYFGPTAPEYSPCPHKTENKNAAIIVSPPSKKAIGDINIYVYLSNVNNEQVSSATVRLYCGPAAVSPSKYTDPTNTDCFCLQEWDPVNFGLTPIIPTAPIPPAKVANCCWAGSYLWHTSDFSIHNKYYGLLAVLDCNETGQHTTPPNALAQDPCAAVLLSPLLP